jgi:hypothetical protein
MWKHLDNNCACTRKLITCSEMKGTLTLNPLKTLGKTNCDTKEIERYDKTLRT